MKHLTAVVVLLVILSGAYGANIVHVFKDPVSYTDVYNAVKGPINEKLVFSRAAKLTSVVVPSQKAFAASGTYDEDISVRVYKTSVPKTTVGEGRFRGKVRYGQALRVPVYQVGKVLPPTLAKNTQYTVTVSFRKAGFYPLHVRRPQYFSGTIFKLTDFRGYIIGLAYTPV